MMTTTALIASALLPLAAQAWTFSPAVSSSFGEDAQGSLLRLKARTPNATASAPILLGGRNVTVRVNITDLELPGLDSDLANPRTVITTWDLSWPTEQDGVFGPVLDDPVNVTCVTNFGTTFDSGANIAGGDCTPAFGDECVSALQDGLGRCNRYSTPQVCESSFPGNGGAYTSAFSNGSQNPMGDDNPRTVWVRYLTQPTEDPKEDYEREVSQLQFLLLRSDGEQPTGYPVCIRVSGAMAVVAGLKQWLLMGAAFVLVWQVI